MNFEKSMLANGLRVVSLERGESETVSIGLWIKTGSAFEVEENNGISHFLEHMVFKGTKNRSALDISEQMENVGGHINAYTGREFTAFYAKVLKKDSEMAMDILADLITNPLFKPKDVEKEKEVVIQEIKQAIDTPDDVIFDYLQERAFEKQAIGRPIAGNENKVRSFSAKTLEKYMKTNYAAENMVVCAVGNISHKKLLKMVEDRLSSLQKKVAFVPSSQIYAGGSFTEKREIEQVHIALGFEGASYYDKDYYAQVLLSTLFGGGLSSRLFQEIREKRGLVYTVYSFNHAHTKSGMFGIYAVTSCSQVEEVLPIVCKEIRKIRNDKVLASELNRAKAQLKANMLMGLESSSSTAEVLARQMLVFDRAIPIKETVEKIEEVKIEDIRLAANKIFSVNPSYVLLGDLSSYMSFEEIVDGCMAR